MRKTMRLKVASCAVALLVGAGSVWGQGRGGNAASTAAPASGGPVDPLLLEDLALSYRILTDKGLMDGLGHSSIRHPSNPNRYFISRNRATGLVTPADLIEMDLDSRPVIAGERSYNEVAIHAEIYKVRPDVMAIIHHHSPGMVSFGMGKVPLMPVNQSSRFLLDGVPWWDYRDINIPGDKGWEETNLIHTPARGAAVARTLGGSPAILLVNHGAVVVGATIQEAVGRAIYMEEAAQVQTAAMQRGGPIKYYDAAGELRATGSRSDFARQWDLWKHDGCVKAGFCKPELANRPAAGRGGNAAAGAGRGAGGGGRGAGGAGRGAGGGGREGREGAPRD